MIVARRISSDIVVAFTLVVHTQIELAIPLCYDECCSMMSKRERDMLKNARGRYLQSHELMPLLGFKPGEHLPRQGFQLTVQGVVFVCNDANNGKHRISFVCKCKRLIPFGRAGQHINSKRCV